MVEKSMIPKSSDESMDFQHEFLWPISSLIGMLRPLHFLILKHISKIEQGDKVLELGSGMIPNYEIYAKKVGDEGVFVALDSRERVLKGATKIAYWFGKVFPFIKEKTSQEVVADAEILPFQDGTFDKVLMNNLPADAVKEVKRVLKEDGIVIFCFNEVFSVPVCSLLYKNLIKKHGFQDIKMFPVSPGHFIPGLFTNWAVVAKKGESKR